MTKPYRGEEKEGLLKEAKMLDIAYPWSLFGEQKLWLKVAKIYKFSSSFINETILADGKYLKVYRKRKVELFPLCANAIT